MTNHDGPWGLPSPTPRPPERGPSRVGIALFLGLLALAGGAVWLMATLSPTRFSQMDGAQAFRYGGILLLMSSGLVYARGVKWGVAARNIALWVGVLSLVLVGYAYRGELAGAGARVRAELIPAYALKSTPREMVLTQGEGGQFYVMGKVNGVRVRFAVDTGASDIVLSPDDARRAGVDLAALDFSRTYETANGAGRGAAFRAGTLEVGAAKFEGVEASVNQAPMSTSLLGMAFLRRLDSFEVKGDQLILRWRPPPR